MSFLDKLFTTGPAQALATPLDQINVVSTPVPNYVLKVLDSGHAVWAPEAVGGPATQIATTGAPINVVGAPPSADDVLTAIDATHAAWVAPAAPVAAGTKFPHLVAPVSADAWDLDPELMTNPDLAANGWSVTALASPFTTLTRQGEVLRNYSGTAPAGGKYNSSLVNGQLWFQPSVACMIWKATDAAHAYTYKSRLLHTKLDVNAVSTMFVGTSNQWAQAGHNFYYCGLDSVNMVEAAIRSGSFDVSNNRGTSEAIADVVNYISTAIFNVAQTCHARLVCALNGIRVIDSDALYGRSVGNAAFAVAGVICQTNTVEEYIPISFIRRLSGLSFP